MRRLKCSNPNCTVKKPEFYTQRKHPCYRCKVCVRETVNRAQKVWRKNHPEEHRARTKAWHKAHPEKMAEYKRRERAKDPGHVAWRERLGYHRKKNENV